MNVNHQQDNSFALIKNAIDCSASLLRVSSDSSSEHEVGIALNKYLQGLAATMVDVGPEVYLQVVQLSQCGV